MSSRSIAGEIRAAAIGALLAVVALLTAAPAWATPLKVGAPAPALTVKALDGQVLDLARQPGKVVVVNLWATWCAPCRAEMPTLDAFYRQHARDGVVLVGVSADRTRDLGKVREAMAHFAFPAALLAQATANELGEPRGLPVTYVLDRRGVVRAVFGFGGDQLTALSLAAAVEPLLGP